MVKKCWQLICVKQLAAKSMDLESYNQEHAMAALNGLSPMYKSLTVALDALGNDNMSFTFDSVKNRLLQEMQRSKKREIFMSDFKSFFLVGVSGKVVIAFGGNYKVLHKYSNHRWKNCENICYSVKDCRGKDFKGERSLNPFLKNNSMPNNSLSLSMSSLPPG